MPAGKFVVTSNRWWSDLQAFPGEDSGWLWHSSVYSYVGQLLWQRVAASDLWPHRRAACGWCRCVRKSLQLEWRGCNLKSTHSLLCFRGRSPRRLARTIFSGVHAPHDRHCAGLGVAFSAAVLKTGWLGGWVSGWLGEWMWAGGRMSVWEGGWVGRRVGG